MKMKKSSILILSIIALFLLTACFNSSKSEEKIVSNNEEVNTSSMKHKKCTREGTAESNIDVSLSYDLYYTGENLDILHSVEKVTATSSADLDKYESAYKKIYKNYEGLKYYDAKVIRGDTTITSDVTINYDKIDTQELLNIEGSEDNIIEDGKAKVDKWLTLAKKFGTECKDVK